jgi:outer membrane protein
MNSSIRTLCILLLLTPAMLKAAPPAQNLKDIYELALQHDSNWAAARYANTAAQEKIEQGKALLLPTVSINSSANHSDTSIEYSGSTVYRNNNQSEKFNTLSYGINVNQPLYRKQNAVQYQSATLQVNFADLQLQQDRQDLLLKSAQAYFDVLLAQDKLTLNQAQKSAISSQLAQAKANFKAGVSTITDVDEAQAKFDTVQSQEIAAYNEIENKKQAIQLLTGQYPAQLSGIQTKTSLKLPVLTEADKSTEHPSDNITLWIQQAQQNNIALNQKKLDYELASKAIELNQAGHLPTLDAVASYNRTNANGGINGFGSDLNNTTIGLQFQMPLYQGGATSSKVREAIANQQKAQEEIEAARRKAELDTRQAYLEVTSNIAQANANEQTLYSTESQLASTNKSFKLGIRTNVDVLNAQQQVFNAKRDLLQTHYNYLLGLLKLKYAIGLLHDQDLEEVNGQLGVGER